MIGASLYLVGLEVSDNSYVKNASSCSMCKRTVINAGIETVYIRKDKDHFNVIPVSDWVKNDESLEGKFGY